MRRNKRIIIMSIIRIPYLFFEQYLLALYNEYKLNNINQYVKQNNRKFL